jgi:hypothetical protein
MELTSALIANSKQDQNIEIGSLESNQDNVRAIDARREMIVRRFESLQQFTASERNHIRVRMSVPCKTMLVGHEARVADHRRGH